MNGSTEEAPTIKAFLKSTKQGRKRDIVSYKEALKRKEDENRTRSDAAEVLTEARTKRQRTELSRAEPKDDQRTAAVASSSLPCSDELLTRRPHDVSLQRRQQKPPLSLPLPDELQTLEKIFNALEATMMATKAVGHRCVYDRIRRSVEASCGRTFDLKRLAQIKTVYPEAYTFQPTQYETNDQIMWSIVIDFASSANSGQPSRIAVGSPAGSPLSFASIAEPSLLTVAARADDRKRRFRYRLLRRVQDEHDRFLLSRGIEPSRPVLSWHPQFDLKDVQIQPASDLPCGRPTMTHSEDRAEETTGSVSARRASVSTTSTTSIAPVKASNTTSAGTTAKSLKAREQALREKIAAKQQKRSQALSPEASKRKTMISRLERISTMINMMFKSHDKAVLRLSSIAQRVSDSYGIPLSQVEVEEHIKLLCKEVPEWLETYNVNGRGWFVRMKHAVPIAEVHERLLKCQSSSSNNDVN